MDFGFEEIKPKLFKKHITPAITFFRDYRDTNAVMYAYDGAVKIDHRQFKEYGAVLRIEAFMSQLQRENQVELLRMAGVSY